MDSAAKKGAHLIVFPEIALQQNPAWSDKQPTEEELFYLHQSAETIPGESTKKQLLTRICAPNLVNPAYPCNA
jgi:predicted amidohydrolase